jgi:flagellar biosynthetic protein FlhB
MADKDQRTEQPTQRRLDKARKEGQFPVSREFVSAVQFTVFVALLVNYAPTWVQEARKVMVHISAAAFQGEVDRETLLAVFYGLIGPVTKPLVILGALLVLSTMAVQLATTRLGFATAKLAPDFQRLNPIKKLQQMPQQNLPQFFQALVLLPLFVFAVWAVVGENLQVFLRLPLATLETGVGRVAASIEDLLWKAVRLFVLVGCVDFYRQRKKWSSELKMSKQEIRDEMKESDGDPHIKMRIRRIMRDLVRRKMMKAVDTATAVVVNPTHYAVALHYLPSEMPAPRVVAKGKNYLALRIRERAVKNQVPIVENPPLARALFKSADVGQEIPGHLYRAVAEVLAYLFKLSGGRLGGGR